MNAVERILSGRDGRASLQRLLIRRSGAVVQISLNIPGFPKNLDGDRVLVEAAAIYFEENIRSSGWRSVCSILIDNGAGAACLMEMPGADPTTLKKVGMDIEDQQWGSILDIDVIVAGGALHRRELGGADRKCFVCGGSAKHCAREQKHDLALLRRLSAGFIKAGLEDVFRQGIRKLPDRPDPPLL